MMWHAAIWIMWKARNDGIFNNITKGVEETAFAPSLLGLLVAVWGPGFCELSVMCFARGLVEFCKGSGSSQWNFYSSVQCTSLSLSSPKSTCGIKYGWLRFHCTHITRERIPTRILKRQAGELYLQF
ncbi:hypothetical protein MTR_2g437070 [Medicago truncatula]|uniref:Uncharacterized protein n=1 Tax=Medicago truncatula TaxID=3880 RepID=A0A072VGJ7_MEDTR|nr:hypothetical protein MTR_2g437070 [Medicago truncatula]